MAVKLFGPFGAVMVTDGVRTCASPFAAELPWTTGGAPETLGTAGMMVEVGRPFTGDTEFDFAC